MSRKQALETPEEKPTSPADPWADYFKYVVTVQNLKDQIIQELLIHSCEDASQYDDRKWCQMVIDYAIYMNKLAGAHAKIYGINPDTTTGV